MSVLRGWPRAEGRKDTGSRHLVRGGLTTMEGSGIISELLDSICFIALQATHSDPAAVTIVLVPEDAIYGALSRSCKL